MAYELYQSRHKGYEIDNLLDDVVDLNTDVANLKTEYDANKVKMSDGTILPLYLVNTYATKTDLSAKADSTQVAADIATATTDMATNTSVASAIATATADMATQTQVASDIATATTDMATNASVASAIAAAAYTLPEATTSTLGGVKPDGTTITVDNDGTIHGAQSLPTGGTSGQVLKKKSATNYDVEWADESGGGGGGGHTIVDTDGTAVAQENKLQFKGLSVTDDSTNRTTKVEGIGLNSDSIDDITTITPEIPSVVIGDANNYSTSEKIIGKWIDGEPLYQRVVVANIPSTPAKTNQDIELISSSDASNINLIYSYGNYLRSDGYLMLLPLAVVNYNDGTVSTSLRVQQYIDKSIKLQHRTYAAQPNTAIAHVVLQYTKTTDT